MIPLKHLALGLLLCAAGACGATEPTAPPPPPFPVTFTNHLDVPVVISVGQTPYGTIPGTAAAAGITQDVVLPGGTTSATWTATNHTFSDGSEIADDLAGNTVLVAALAKIGITNSVSGTTYIDLWLVNQLAVSVDFAVFNGSTVRCLGSQGTGTDGWGYYAMTATTEVRYYAAGSHCTGTYRYWTAQQAIGASFAAGFAFFYATEAP